MSKSLSGGPKTKLIAIVGPTASGKTDLAIKVAKNWSGEIICADSRTVYKHLDIGTAKPTQNEQKAVKHHLLDVVEPDQDFTVADFKRLANEAIKDIQSRGKLPILVGGSGLYIDSVLYNFSFAEDSERDPDNPRHSAVNTPKTRQSLPVGVLFIGLNPGREAVKQRIAARVDKMIASGLEKEVRDLSVRYGWEGAMTGVGYQEWQAYFTGEQTIEETRDLIVVHSSQYAKRQMTWFLRNKDVQWFTSTKAAEQFLDSSLERLNT